MGIKDLLAKWFGARRRAAARYRLLCVECAPGTDWISTYCGPCDGCGAYRNLMVMRVVR